MMEYYDMIKYFTEISYNYNPYLFAYRQRFHDEIINPSSSRFGNNPQYNICVNNNKSSGSVCYFIVLAVRHYQDNTDRSNCKNEFIAVHVYIFFIYLYLFCNI